MPDTVVNIVKTLFSTPRAHWLMRLGIAVVAGSLLVTATVAGAAPQLWRAVSAHDQTPVQLPSFSGLATRTKIVDTTGRQIGVFEFENSQPISIDAIPDHVVAAFLAVEDEGFEEHKGVNLRALVRAALANFQFTSGRQGASTITQQVVKNEYLAGLPRDGRYKILQARYAVMLEKTVSKKQIVERYLNVVFLGNNAYGLQAAAEVYFGTKVADLTLAQAGFLAGLVRAPSTYDPIRRPEQARRRYRQVLERFVETGLMTQDESVATFDSFVIPETAGSVPLQSTNRSYFTEMVRDYLLNKSNILGATYQERFNALYRGGITIHATIDADIQAKAERAAQENLPVTAMGIQSSLVSVDNASGAVRALVGGPGFEAGRNEVNLALRRRQTGSTSKLFVLTAALEAGAQPKDLIDGTMPCTFPNPGLPSEPFVLTQGVSKGVTTLEEHTWLSINCAYARLAQIVGLNRVVNAAYRMSSSVYLTRDNFKIQPYASFSTGANEMSAFDMASATQTIANSGVHHEPYFIEKIEGPTGVIFQHQPNPQLVLTQQVADTQIDILKKTLTLGTARRTPLEGGRPSAGKTGTQDENTNAWFVGSTKQLTTAVWVGDPKGYTPMVNVPEFRRDGVPRVTGGTYPARIWKAFMDQAHIGVPALDWSAPTKVQQNPKRLYLPGVDCTAQLVSGRLPRTATGTVNTVVPTSTTTTSTIASTTTAVPGTGVVPEPIAPPVTVATGPEVRIVDPGTTIAPTDLNPLTPIVGVDPENTYIYDCVKGIPPTVRVVE
jgi:penicillin-binding protein 1A